MARSNFLTGEHAQGGWLAGEAHLCRLTGRNEARQNAARVDDGARRLRPPAKTRGAMLQQDQACSSGCAQNSYCRFFLCARCRRQALVCSRCDRGQMYCGRDCALEARRWNQREARARYQATVRGREMHAERSHRYRARHRRVTDQGLIPPTLTDQPAAPAIGTAVAVQPVAAIAPLFRTSCHRCGKPASDFVRLSPIRRPLRRSIEKRSGRPTRRR